MRETDDDLEHLQALMERSIAGAGPFLRSSFEMPDHSLSARQMVRHLDGLFTLAFATLAQRGEPRVAPIAALLFRGHFCIPTTLAAARTRHVRHRPGVSLTYFEGNDVAVIAHGQAEIVAGDRAEFVILEALHRELVGVSVNEWGEGAFLRVEPHALYTYARYPERFLG